MLAPHYRFISLALVLALVAADPALQRLWTAHAQTLPPTGEVRTTTFTYDFEGRLTQVAAPEGTIHYGYDLITGRHTSTWTAYTHVEYGRDLLGRLETVRVLKRNGETVNDTTTYTYTPVGSREAVYLPNGVSTHHQYDSLNRLTNLTHRASNNSVLAEYSYTLGQTGRREAVTEIILDDDDTTYATNNIAWGYDDLYRLTSETNNGSVVSYEYDLVGNRHKKTAGSTVDYAYNANDQLLSETNGTEVTTYAYDKNGSLTNKTAEGVSTNAYAYNLANRLSSVTGDGATTSFLYNYLGIRVRSAGSGGQRHFLVDHRNPTGYAQVLEEASSQGSAPMRSYVIGDDVLGQCGLSTTDPQWLLYDGHGSTRQLLSDTGQVDAQYDFDAYGVAKQSLQNPLTTLLYSGEAYDPALKAYHLRARYYNPETGRFNRRDTFSGNQFDPASLHRYMGLHADPINNVDPSGLMTFTLGELLQVAWIRGMLVGMVAGGITGGYRARDTGLWGMLKGIAVGALMGALLGAAGGIMAQVSFVTASMGPLTALAVEVLTYVLRSLITGGFAVVNEVVLSAALGEDPNIKLSFFTGFAVHLVYGLVIGLPHADAMEGLGAELAEAGVTATIATTTSGLVDFFTEVIEWWKEEYAPSRTGGAVG